nr:MAG TPA: hypothetical protein [Microviridae sp.]
MDNYQKAQRKWRNSHDSTNVKMDVQNSGRNRKRINQQQRIRFNMRNRNKQNNNKK